jgi:hypothetical protein
VFHAYIAAKEKLMALLTGELKFTGTLGDFSAYRMKGSDKIIIRRKGGPQRAQVKKHPNFTITRKQNAEFAGAVLAYVSLKKALFPVNHLSNFNFTGQLTGLCKYIQQDDMTNVLGQRSVLLSQHYYKLEGFSLNREYNFESFVKHPLQYSMDKTNGTASVQLPEMIPGINLTNPNGQPLYRFVFVLGAVADIIYDETRKMYKAAIQEEVFPAVAYTDWHTHKQRMEATEITLAISSPPDLSNYTLLLAVGIEFGMPLTNTEVRPVKRDGAAKILKMGYGSREWGACRTGRFGFISLVPDILLPGHSCR